MEESLKQVIQGIFDTDLSTWATVAEKRDSLIKGFEQMALDSLPLGADADHTSRMVERFATDLELTIRNAHPGITTQVVESESVRICQPNGCLFKLS